MFRPILSLTAVLCIPSLTMAGSRQAERTLGKEPTYKTNAPKYGLLRFDAQGKNQVWIVLDGDSLYVDRNGNGDLTEPGEKIGSTKSFAEGVLAFDVGDLTVSGQVHKGLGVSFVPLWRYAEGPLGTRPDLKAALAKDPKGLALSLRVDVMVPGMKGGGMGGRVTFIVGPIDLAGAFQLAESRANAPIVHFGGPLEITFYSERPRLRVGRETELVLVVGTPGHGPGTFAMIGYEDTIPGEAKPVAEIVLPPAKIGEPPVKQRFEIKDRC